MVVILLPLRLISCKFGGQLNSIDINSVNNTIDEHELRFFDSEHNFVRQIKGSYDIEYNWFEVITSRKGDLFLNTLLDSVLSRYYSYRANPNRGFIDIILLNIL